MIKIVGAIDETEKVGFEQTLTKFSGLGCDVQLDFNDGSFGNFKTVAPQDVSDLIAKHSGQINFEAHLMVQKPFDYIPKLIESGVKKIILQYEINDNLRDLLEQLEQEDCLMGIAIGPETQIEQIEPFLELVDTITIMTVSPGEQGQPFDPSNLNKITDLRNLGFEGEIEVDGGINETSATAAMQFNPDTVVVGKYLVASESIADSYSSLESVLEGKNAD